MESNKLQVFESVLPLKAYPSDSTIVDDTLRTSFKFWLASLLSLKADNEDKLDAALPIIKEHFWSLGFVEIKKAFSMYAMGKLKTEPISNYFDIILVGKIFKEYKEQQPVKKKVIKMAEPTQEEKDLLIYQGLIFCFDNWEQTGEIINGQLWIHEHLMELGLLVFTDIEKKAMWNLALKDALEKSKDLPYHEAKDIVKELENKNSTIRINEYKRIRLKRYFSRIKHIKDVL